MSGESKPRHVVPLSLPSQECSCYVTCSECDKPVLTSLSKLTLLDPEHDGSSRM